MSTEQPELTPEELEQIAQERVADLGKALGFNEEFTRDIQLRGQDALIDRADYTDKAGTLGRALSMVQRVGAWLQENAEQGGEPPPPGAIQEATAYMAEQHDLDRLMGSRLVWTVMEVFNQAENSITREKKGG